MATHAVTNLNTFSGFDVCPCYAIMILRHGITIELNMTEGTTCDVCYISAALCCGVASAQLG